MKPFEALATLRDAEKMPLTGQMTMPTIHQTVDRIAEQLQYVSARVGDIESSLFGPQPENELTVADMSLENKLIYIAEKLDTVAHTANRITSRLHNG